MPCIEWSPLFSVGVDKMDAQHRELIAITNEFCEAYQANRGHQSVPSILNKLISYAQEHFRDEEELMRTFGFEGFEEHKEKHEQMVDKIFSIVHAFEKGSVTAPDDLNTFLREWLIEHILKEDMQYRDIFSGQRQAKAGT